MRVYKYIFLLTLFSIASCKNDARLQEDLQIYLDRFEMEANQRGLSFETEVNNTEIHLVEIIVTGVLGQCVREDAEPNEIHIDRDYWRTASDLEKEFVVFHELGHCILNRGHINEPDSDGRCLSIMYDGNSSQCILSYNEDNKDQLIDELFE